MSSLAFPMNEFKLPEDTEDVVRKIWSKLGSWRAFVSVVDGHDDVGRSVFSRYLAFRLNMPVFHSDEWLIGNGQIQYFPDLEQTLKRRLADDKPLIYDGIFGARTLNEMGISPDLVVRVAMPGSEGSSKFSGSFPDYEREYPAGITVQSVFCR